MYALLLSPPGLDSVRTGNNVIVQLSLCEPLNASATSTVRLSQEKEFSNYKWLYLILTSTGIHTTNYDSIFWFWNLPHIVDVCYGGPSACITNIVYSGGTISRQFELIYKNNWPEEGQIQLSLFCSLPIWTNSLSLNSSNGSLPLIQKPGQKPGMTYR